MIAALIDHLWQSTLFCGGIWLITLTMQSNAAALRHSLWMLASVKFLVPFSILFLAGTYIGLPAASVIDDQPLMLDDALQSVATLVAPTRSLRASESGASSALVVALLAIWLGGALFIAMRSLIAWRSANSMVRAARPAPGALLDTRVTHADIGPAVARVFRPVVLLPAALLGRLTDSQMNAVLAHEHEHVRRHDNLKANIHRLVEALFWFHPAVWWIGRQMLEERERACDEAVLDNGHEASEYAAGILAVCRHCIARSPLAAAATAGNLTQRIRCILGSQRPASPGAFKLMSLLACTIAVAVAPLFAGAVDNTKRRLEILSSNSHALLTADIAVGPAAAGMGQRQSLRADRNVVLIRNSTLRGLVALAYGVNPWEIRGGGPWLDDARYDIRAFATNAISEPEDLDPYALRGVVNRLLASRFDLEIHVNARCQAPCGRYALADARRAQ